VVDSCEHGNEPLAYITGSELLGCQLLTSDSAARSYLHQASLLLCEISSSHGGEYDG
jgi:hypothetical protein